MLSLGTYAEDEPSFCKRVRPGIGERCFFNAPDYFPRETFAVGYTRSVCVEIRSRIAHYGCYVVRVGVRELERRMIVLGCVGEVGRVMLCRYLRVPVVTCHKRKSLSKVRQGTNPSRFPFLPSLQCRRKRTAWCP